MRRLRKICIVLYIVLAIIGLSGIAHAAGWARLDWDAPTTNTDGTPLTDLGGYKVYQGTASRVYGTPKDVGNVLTTINTPLADGTYFFAVTAYDTSGNESVFSNEVSKTVNSLPPVVSLIAVNNITATGATITWTTNTISSTQVEYGLTTVYGSLSTMSPVLVTNHSQALTGLAGFTTYHFRVISIDPGTNKTISTDATFTTKDIIAPSPPTNLRSIISIIVAAIMSFFRWFA